MRMGCPLNDTRKFVDFIVAVATVIELSSVCPFYIRRMYLVHGPTM